MEYTTVRLTAEAGRAARAFTRQLAAAADVSLTQSDAIGAAVMFASEHLPEIAARVRRARTQQEGDAR